ncbi:ubiquitin-protein ligase (E3) [Pseudogymnoascus australis]
MFQSFSGSSRRTRQVNLSGQDINPFEASSWAPTASGTQKTLAAAQHERHLRQVERERLVASKNIQRIWRGHRVRKDVANSRRQAWDLLDSQHAQEEDLAEPVLLEELNLLLAFFNYKNPEDISRLVRLCDRLLRRSQAGQAFDGDLGLRLSFLVVVLLDALSVQPQPSTDTMVQVLTSIVKWDPSTANKTITRYYTILSDLLIGRDLPSQSKTEIFEAFAEPLVDRNDIDDMQRILHDAYVSMAFSFLTTPDLATRVGDMKPLAEATNIDILSQAILQDDSRAVLDDMNPESRLWLLAHFIHLHTLCSTQRQEPGYIRALSTILSLSANDIFGRIEVSQPGVLDTSEEVDGSEPPSQALPEFIRSQVISLVNKQSITDLLAKFDSEHGETRPSGSEGDDSLLSSYALTLLRTFPTLGEEIRMWLYQASVTVTGGQIPAVKLFWRIMKQTSIFTSISTDSKAALDILRRPFKLSDSPAATSSDATRDRDWRAILLFLELYAFALRFTDDEEFLSGGEAGMTEQRSVLSRSRESALPLRDVKLLSVFLKNLSFTMYFHAANIQKDDRQEARATLSSYFSTSAKDNNFSTEPSTEAPTKDAKNGKNLEFLGIAGMTYDYVRNIVTRVMKMLYERDSRRRFLPPDHWLMTSRFDMGSFIPAVVAEEERQHQLNVEDGEDEEQNIEYEPTRPIRGRGRSTIQAWREIAARERQKKTRASARAAVGPILEVLQNMPYVIPFKTRVQVFRQFAHQDQYRRRSGNTDPDVWRMLNMPFPGSEGNSRHHARIRRDSVLEDAFSQFFTLGEGLKEPIQITFVDKFDNVEAGIDGGGVTKEFLTTVTNEAFRSVDGPGYFVTNDQNLLYPNPAAVDQCKDVLRKQGWQESDSEWNESITQLLKRYEFLGRVVGKCLYEGILVDIGFSGFFLLKWAAAATADSASELRYQANINDLRDLDETLYQGLLQLKNYTGNAEDFALDFTIDDVVSLANEPVRTVTRELIPNGANKPVTNENRVLYISLVARHRLHSQPYHQTRAFLRGLSQIIQPSWLSMFNQTELQTLIGGDMAEIDVDDLRRNTEYSGVYVIGDDGLEHPTINLFWQVMKQLDDQDRRKVLKYVTSTPRSPLLGFGQLNPKFSIRDAGGDEQRLPSASTCINLLKLPRYTSAKTLSEKLLYAINSGAGFDLS